MPADKQTPCEAQVDQSRLKNSSLPHNLKRHSTSSSFGLNLANAFSLRMSQIMDPEPSCLLFHAEQIK